MVHEIVGRSEDVEPVIVIAGLPLLLCLHQASVGVTAKENQVYNWGIYMF